MPHMLKQALDSILTPQESESLYSAFDQIGDIVIIKISDNLKSKKDVVAKAILANIKTANAVFAQVSAVRGEYRIRDLELLAGEDRTITEYKEHGCRFKVDVARTYFSPRLSTERLRIARMVGDNETIVNMFAGVGTFSIIIAKMNRTCNIIDIDSNLAASELDKTNTKLNKVQDRVTSIAGNADDVIARQLRGRADRVLMPLPERAKEFVKSAVLALKPHHVGVIHYFAHIKANNKKACYAAGILDISNAFKEYRYNILHSRVVREVGPRIYQIVADVAVDKD
jgi:tRNA (guanine37-N1)-methyltransferase